MSDEKQKEIKIASMSFSSALKFWLAFLVVQIVGAIVILVIGAMVFTVFVQPTLQNLIERLSNLPTAPMNSFKNRARD